MSNIDKALHIIELANSHGAWKWKCYMFICRHINTYFVFGQVNASGQNENENENDIYISLCGVLFFVRANSVINFSLFISSASTRFESIVLPCVHNFFRQNDFTCL